MRADLPILVPPAAPSTAQEAADLPAHDSHRFARKLLQPHLYENLLSYVRWQAALRRGEQVAAPEFGPVSINLDITTACNHYCHHCVDLDVLNSGQRLTLAAVEELAGHLVDRGLRSVILIGGGEPTLHPEFRPIVAHLKSRRLRLGIVSNGVRTEELGRVAQLLEPEDWLRLSLDAATDESFAIIHNSRSKKTLTQILDEMSAIRAQFSAFQLGYSFLALSEEFRENDTALCDNLGEIPLAASMARAHGFSYLSVKPFIGRETRAVAFLPAYAGELRRQLDLARRFETADFKVVESLNLLALLNGEEERWRRQPRTCHVNFFRSVVTPDGGFNCPMWRGFDGARLGPSAAAESGSEFAATVLAARGDNLATFDAGANCARVTCLYNQVNWFIEDLVSHPEKLAELEPALDGWDYFL